MEFNVPKLIFVNSDGNEKYIEAENGLSLMEVARDNDMGVEGTCGGSISCCTCHVVIDKDWFSVVGGPNEDEEDSEDGEDTEDYDEVENPRPACVAQMEKQVVDGLLKAMQEALKEKAQKNNNTIRKGKRYD